jgi:hypothetical protein
MRKDKNSIIYIWLFSTQARIEVVNWASNGQLYNDLLESYTV